MRLLMSFYSTLATSLPIASETGIRWERLSCASETEGAIKDNPHPSKVTNVKGGFGSRLNSFFDDLGTLGVRLSASTAIVVLFGLFGLGFGFGYVVRKRLG
jgi:hypothetical protein